MTQPKQPPSILAVTLSCLYAAIIRGIQIVVCLGILVLLLTRNTPAAPTDAETGEITDLDQIRQGTLLFRAERALTVAPALNTDVQIAITGLIARVKVRQDFHNTSGDWQEGIYVFPLPHDAAVDHMTLQIGERVIEGQIQEREAAKKTYQKARESGRKAALVEQERPNVFTTSVANIAPDETVTVEIQYQQSVRFENGVFRLRFPLAVAPRYIPGTPQVSSTINSFDGRGWARNTDEVPDASRITPPVLHPEQGLTNPVKLQATINAGFTLSRIDSPYHRIAIDETDTHRYHIQLARDAIPANRDFELVWQAEMGKEPQAALFTETLQDEYALLMIMPTARAQAKAVNRELIFVIDTSGSMAGTSLVQAKAALEQALGTLQPGDRFNILQFNSVTEQLFSLPQPLSHQSLRQARDYIAKLEAQGGTEMAPALQAALTTHGETVPLRQVIFLTDGSIGNEKTLFEIIQARLGSSRLFTVGIGSAPNGHFMQRAARFGRGTHTFIGNLDEVQQKMAVLLEKLQFPVLTDIRLDWAGDQPVEAWPAKIPDLYRDQPLLVTVKAGQLPGSVTVSGKLADRNWQQQLQLTGGDTHPGIGKLWARNKIAALMDARHVNTEADNVREKIVTTALNHHLVSRYTSLVAVDITPVRPHDKYLDSRAVPVNLPAGWVFEKVFGMPATATPSQWHLVIGSLLLLLTIVLCFFRYDVFRI